MTNTLKANLATAAAVKTNLGLTLTLTNVGVISDTTAPVVTVTPGAQSNDSTGKFSAVVNYNGTVAYDCYYQILSGTTAPTATNIQSCTSTTSCGKVVLQAPSVTISNTVTPAFTIGTAYTVWATCYNRVPGAQLASTVINVYSFTPVCPTGKVVTNGACTDPVVPPPPSTTTSSNFVFMSIASMIAVIFLIFN
jgi:hypothetical protein